MILKKLATTAFVAILVACSDGFEDNLSQQNLSVENRPKAHVTISVNDEVENTTRFVFGKTASGYRWSFEDDDQMGLLLMDQWNGNGTYGNWNDYSFLDQPSKNYSFVYREKYNVFSCDSHIFEGNYFFYYPYDSSVSSRQYVGWKVNPNQRNYDPETGDYNIYQAYKDNQCFIGYKFINLTGVLEEGVAANIRVNLVPIFSSYFFSFENMSNVAFKAEKFVLRNKNKKALPTSLVLAPSTMDFGTGNGNFASIMNSANSPSYKDIYNNLWKKVTYQSDGDVNKALHNSQHSNVDIDWAPKTGTINYLVSLCETNNRLISYIEHEGNMADTFEYSVEFGSKCVIKCKRNSNDKEYKLLSNLILPNGTYDDMVGVLYGKRWDTAQNGGNGDWIDTEIRFPNMDFDGTLTLSATEYGTNYIISLSFDDESYINR